MFGKPGISGTCLMAWKHTHLQRFVGKRTMAVPCFSQELTWKERDRGPSLPWCLERHHTGPTFRAAGKRGPAGAAGMTKCTASPASAARRQPLELGAVMDFFGGAECAVGRPGRSARLSDGMRMARDMAGVA